MNACRVTNNFFFLEIFFRKNSWTVEIICEIKKRKSCATVRFHPSVEKTVHHFNFD